MLNSLIEGIFPSKKRAFILIYVGEEVPRQIIIHPDETKFVLEKRESAATAARFILKDYFHNIHQDVDIHLSKTFEFEKVEYQIIKFDGPLVANSDGSDGFENMKKDGYDLILIGDHPLSPKIKKVLGL
jgi:hypothetical protein